MTKKRSTAAGRARVQKFIAEEGISFVPTPHGEQRSEITVLLGDGTWMSFADKEAVVDWLQAHMTHRGLKVSNPSSALPASYFGYLLDYEPTRSGKGKQVVITRGEDHSYVTTTRTVKAAKEYIEQAIRNRSRLETSDLAAAGVRGHDTSPWGADAKRQIARRNPSPSREYWWAIIVRDDGTAIAHRYADKDTMMRYSKRHAKAFVDDSKALIRGKEPMTEAKLKEGFRTAYPKIALEV
jgi:hypothetical protein